MARVNNDAVLHPFQLGENTSTTEIATSKSLGLVSIGPSLSITTAGVLSLKYFNLENIVDKVVARTNLGVHSIEYINTMIESLDTSIEALEVDIETLQSDIAAVNAQHTNDLIILNASISKKLDSTDNAVSASKLATEITINGIPFDGSQSIEIPLTETSTPVDLTEINSHIASRANPHGVTKAQIGLDSVDNTSDISKPISTATQEALDTKVASTTFNAFKTSVEEALAVEAPTVDLSLLEAKDIELENSINTKLGKTEVAVSAAKLANFVNIQGVPFNGESNITLPKYSADIDGLVPKSNTATPDHFLSADGSWKLIEIPDIPEVIIPEDKVTSVNGLEGAVVLDKTHVGLNNVDNTSDLAKPISTDTQTALDSKASNQDLLDLEESMVSTIDTFRNQTNQVLNLKLDSDANAVSATKLNTARRLTVGNTGKNFDGSNNVSWSLTEIGAAPVVHTHDYLPLTGGSISGTAASTSATTGALVVAGGVGIGGALFTAGAITSAGNVTAYSDKRIKDNILPVEDAVSKLLTLQGITFTRNDVESDRRYIGLIAQHVQSVFPEAITVLEDERKTLTVDYQGLVGVLVEAIKELNQRIDILEGK